MKHSLAGTRTWSPRKGRAVGPAETEEDREMSVNPEAAGEPTDEADDHLKDANADDPRSDPQAPAHEPATADDAGQEASRAARSD
jgi:hypothetical protein